MKQSENQVLLRNSLFLWAVIGGGLVAAFYLMFQKILMPFIVALIIAYILQPIVEKLAALNFSRSFSSLLLVGGFILFIIAFILFAIPFVKNELLFFAHRFPSQLQTIEAALTPYFSKAWEYFNHTSIDEVKTTLSNYLGDMFSWTLKVFAGLFTSSLAIANLISLIVLTPLITFYTLRDWPQIERFFINLVPVRSRPIYESLWREVQQTLSAYFRGQASVCLLLTFYYIIGLKVAGLNFAFIIGFLSGFLAFIPYVGFIIAFLAALGTSLVQFASLEGVLWIVAIYGGGHLLEAFFLTPNLVGDRIGLHPVWVIFSLLAGGVVAGFSGMLVAVPVAAIINILMRFLFNVYRQSSIFLGRPLPAIAIESGKKSKKPKK